jgi:pyruvate/2-oxoglutarate dehydrogenase complex dihydrolipoamide acyltransferase (E2) component
VIAVNGKPEVANIVNVNCVIDHRYLYSGGKGKNLISTFKKVFEAPEKYLGEASKIESKKK